MTIGDYKIDAIYLIENQLFVELIIFLTCRFFELITIFKVTAIGNFFGSLRRVFGIFWSMYFLSYSMLWYKNINMLSSIKTLSGKNHFNIGLAWVVAIYVLLEVLWANFELFWYALKIYRSRTNDTLKKELEQGTETPTMSYKAFLDEVTFMYQDKKAASERVLCLFYNWAALCRWGIFSIISIIFYTAPRNCYALFIIVQGILVLWLWYSWRSFRRPAFSLIMISELFIFCKIVALFIWFQSRF